MTIDAAIEVAGLRKTFRTRRGKRVALDGLDMVVPAGGVHGFLGPNGSGKTTTIRMLLGLVRADAGVMRVLDHEVPDELADVVGSVGAVVESPQFFPTFSGRRNLRLLATVGGLPMRRVDEVLEIVGLRERARDRYKGYSLGMRQRLAIAATLLKSPRLLVLDEPTNGLDPAGIRDVRDLMRRLVDVGTTVLLSSHILAEVQQVCDSVTILNDGRHVRSGSVRDVLALDRPGTVRLRVGDASAIDEAQRVLEEAGFAVRREDDALFVEKVPNAGVLTEKLAARRLFVSELGLVGADLETVFLGLTAAGGPEPREIVEADG